MAKKTEIQWCDSTTNPIQGCLGCELWPTVARIISNLIAVICLRLDQDRLRVRTEVEEVLQGLSTATAVWHGRHRAVASMAARFPGVPGGELLEAIEKLFRCYAGILHLRFGENAENPEKRTSPGYAPTFEQPTRFAGRMETASRWSDLRGQDRAAAPWLDGLPRLIFVSDMGDALSDGIPFSFLKDEIITSVISESGARHRWLWLTKRPGRMAEFASWLQDEHEVGWPANLVAMTSVTNRATRARIAELQEVPARVRGLSVEPLVEGVDLDLEGIDWVIAGGESGKHARPFDLAWARSLRDQCRAAGAAFFVKQLGAHPVEAGERLRLNNGHGGDWSEWPDDLRIREMPQVFRESVEVVAEAVA